MSNGMQVSQNIRPTFTPFGLPIVGRPSLLKQDLIRSTQPLIQKFMNAAPYPESAAQWLLNLLDLLTGIVDRNENLDRVVVTEVEYRQLLKALENMMYGVGADEDHPLSAAMTLVGMLIKIYEDKHFPKLTDLFPELAEKTPDKTIRESQNIATMSGQIETDFAIVFFVIGCLLWIAGKTEKAISAHDLAIRIEPEYASVYASRGEVKSGLNYFTDAKVDLQKALALAEEHGENEFLTVIGQRLREFDVLEAAVVYFSEPRFAKFSILRECRIQIGTIQSRTDIVLRDAEGNFVAIVECKLLRDSDRDNYGHNALKTFLCATDTPFGIFASGTRRDSWVFYENLRHNRFRQIERADFEKRVLA